MSFFFSKLNKFNPFRKHAFLLSILISLALPGNSFAEEPVFFADEISDSYAADEDDIELSDSDFIYLKKVLNPLMDDRKSWLEKISMLDMEIQKQWYYYHERRAQRNKSLEKKIEELRTGKKRSQVVYKKKFNGPDVYRLISREYSGNDINWKVVDTVSIKSGTLIQKFGRGAVNVIFGIVPFINRKIERNIMFQRTQSFATLKDALESFPLSLLRDIPFSKKNLSRMQIGSSFSVLQRGGFLTGGGINLRSFLFFIAPLLPADAGGGGNVFNCKDGILTIKRIDDSRVLLTQSAVHTKDRGSSLEGMFVAGAFSNAGGGIFSPLSGENMEYRAKMKSINFLFDMENNAAEDTYFKLINSSDYLYAEKTMNSDPEAIEVEYVDYLDNISETERKRKEKVKKFNVIFFHRAKLNGVETIVREIKNKDGRYLKAMHLEQSKNQTGTLFQIEGIESRYVYEFDRKLDTGEPGSEKIKIYLKYYDQKATLDEFKLYETIFEDLVDDSFLFDIDTAAFNEKKYIDEVTIEMTVAFDPRVLSSLKDIDSNQLWLLLAKVNSIYNPHDWISEERRRKWSSETSSNNRKSLKRAKSFFEALTEIIKNSSGTEDLFTSLASLDCREVVELLVYLSNKNDFAYNYENGGVTINGDRL